MISTLYYLITGSRDWRWPRVSQEYLDRNTSCCVCGGRSTVVHHVVPVSQDKSLELAERNFAAMCRWCHFTVGHWNNWKRWNKSFWPTVMHCRLAGSHRNDQKIVDS